MAGAKVSIAELRPTQLTLGLAEVESRAAKIAAMSPADREAYLQSKPIPYVLGPGKQLYIVDHHHLARALWSLKIPEVVLGDQLADWSGLETKAFWRMMEFAALLLAHRRRRQSQALCCHSRLNRRPHRQCLADAGGTLRGKAFEDQDTPFQEFMWGDYFRTFMSRRLIELQFDLAAELATKLARLSEAQDLPGYWG